jgi:putative phosphoesterase
VTKLAILSDVHGDLHALRGALEHISRMRCEAVVCAGDLVDYGPWPNATIALLRTLAIPCIRGNHDRWAVAEARAGTTRPAPATHATALSEGSLSFLASLPTSWEAKLDGVRVAMHHASPSSDMHPILPQYAAPNDVRHWLQEANADVLIVGHTHCAFELRTLGLGRIFNPGALLRTVSNEVAPGWQGFPREGGTFGVLELPEMRFSVHDCRSGAAIEIPVAVSWVTDHHPPG